MKKICAVFFSNVEISYKNVTLRPIFMGCVFLITLLNVSFRQGQITIF